MGETPVQHQAGGMPAPLWRRRGRRPPSLWLLASLSGNLFVPTRFKAAQGCRRLQRGKRNVERRAPKGIRGGLWSETAGAHPKRIRGEQGWFASFLMSERVSTLRVAVGWGRMVDGSWLRVG